MTPSPLEVSRERVRTAAVSLRLAVGAGRADLALGRSVSAEAWELLDRLGPELAERLGELERAERAEVV